MRLVVSWCCVSWWCLLGGVLYCVVFWLFFAGDLKNSFIYVVYKTLSICNFICWRLVRLYVFYCCLGCYNVYRVFRFCCVCAVLMWFSCYIGCCLLCFVFVFVILIRFSFRLCVFGVVLFVFWVGL